MAFHSYTNTVEKKKEKKKGFPALWFCLLFSEMLIYVLKWVSDVFLVSGIAFQFSFTDLFFNFYWLKKKINLKDNISIYVFNLPPTLFVWSRLR